MQILGRRKYRKMRKRGKAGFNPAEKKKEKRYQWWRAQDTYNCYWAQKCAQMRRSE